MGHRPLRRPQAPCREDTANRSPTPAASGPTRPDPDDDRHGRPGRTGSVASSSTGASRPKRVREQRGRRFARSCDAIIDDVCEQGECDFVWDIAAPLPLIMIGDALGVAPEDRDDLLRWSDDMLARPDAARPEDVDAQAAEAFVGYTEYADRVIADRRDEPARRPHERARARRGRRRPARPRLTHARVAAHPHRRRRDHPPRHHRRRLPAAAPTPTSGEAGRPTRPDPHRGRGDAALGDADQEHGPHRHPRRRASAASSSHEGEKLLLLYPSANRDERRVRRPVPLRHRPRTRTTTSRSASAPTSASATASPGSSCAVMFEQLLDPPARPRARRRRRARLPARQLRQRLRGACRCTFTPTAKVGAGPV